MEPFRTLSGRVEGELKEKGSRFLAIAVPVRARDDAETFIAAQTARFREATHVVPAFLLHDGTAFASDAGEPAGSSGPPLLHAIEGAGLADVAAVVVRWFGGTKLGIGGLVRAYSGALQLALADAATTAAVPALRVVVRYDHDRTSPVLRTVTAHGGRDLDQEYGEGVTCTFTMPAAAWDAFVVHLRDATQGAIGAERVGNAVIYA
jgi:putative IMPACT (imprinted ancient) family translation regulator